MKSLGRLFWALSAIAFAVGSGCGNPELVSNSGLNSSGGVGDDGSGATAAKGTGASLSFGGDATGGATGDCPATCAELDADCGFVTDTKCGGVIQCGAHCPAGEVCGGGGNSKCGKGTAVVGGVCMPSTCDELNANCGYVTDTKCGGVVRCGTKCKTGEVCGGTDPNQCGVAVGGGGTCIVDPATTCAGRGYTCGQAADNCGNPLDCGPDTCANPSEKCFQGTCKPSGCVVDPAMTCAGMGYSCGQAADNCGNMLTCGAACSIPGFTCGGGSDKNGKPIAGVCGCTGACSLIPDCGTGKTTTLSGKVYDPAGEDPLYHVLVYIANDPTDPALTSFPKGITCDVCGASAAGSPLVSDPTLTDPPAGTYTGVDGSFTLKNVPVGKALTLVIQLGRWRRVFKVDVTKSCAANTIPDKTLLMPSTKAQGDIPLMAMVTGSADSLECVLRKMGISSTEFTDPAKGGRVQFYGGNKAAGQTIDAATPTQSMLFGTAAGKPVIDDYDMVILACQGDEYLQASADLARLRTYADQGGRVFATHYSYVWETANDAKPGAKVGTADNWSEVAKWHRDEHDRPRSAVGIIDKLSNPKAAAFQGWLEAVNASAVGSGQISVDVIRHDADGISAIKGQTQQWLYREGDSALHCNVSGKLCTSNNDCTAKVCQVNSGQACNGNADCSPMACEGSPQTACTSDSDCIIGRNRSKCRTNPCSVNTCADYRGTHTPLHFTFNTPVNLTEDLTKTPPAVQCGRVLFSDFHVQDANENGETYPQECGANCTKNSDCTGKCDTGKCPWGAACKADADCASTCSTDGRCLDPMTPQEKLLEFMIFDLGSCVPPPKTCVPATTCPADQDCGYAPDGCGGLVMCGNCPKGEACGVGNPPVANKCGSVTCTPGVCPKDQACGYASDGCSGAVLCGTCPKGQTCNAGKCDTGKCTPQSCTDQGIKCGSAGDQCGNQVDCPTCAPGAACVNGACIPEGCTPVSCAKQEVQCGPAADGCGNMISSCGQCAAGQLCVLGKCKSVN